MFDYFDYGQEAMFYYMSDMLASEVTQKLSEYIELRFEERRLRARVDFLEKQAAQHGFLSMDVDLAMLLEEEKVELKKTRRELALLESQLQEQKDIPLEKRTDITVARLEQTLSDVKAKREQLLIYQANINYLEEKQAQLGLGASLDLFNELILTNARLLEVQTQLSELEQKINDEWGIELGALQNLTTMSKSEIEAFAHKVVNDKQRLENEEAEKKRARAEEQKLDFNEFIKITLQELRDAVYPNCKIDYLYGCWTIYKEPALSGINTKVSIWLESNIDGIPKLLKCERKEQIIRPIRTRKTIVPWSGLSRGRLIEALKELYPAERKKRRWQFWVKPLPDSWLG